MENKSNFFSGFLLALFVSVIAGGILLHYEYDILQSRKVSINTQEETIERIQVDTIIKEVQSTDAKEKPIYSNKKVEQIQKAHPQVISFEYGDCCFVYHPLAQVCSDIIHIFI